MNFGSFGHCHEKTHCLTFQHWTAPQQPRPERVGSRPHYPILSDGTEPETNPPPSLLSFLTHQVHILSWKTSRFTTSTTGLQIYRKPTSPRAGKAPSDFKPLDDQLQPHIVDKCNFHPRVAMTCRVLGPGYFSVLFRGYLSWACPLYTRFMYSRKQKWTNECRKKAILLGQS